MKTELSPLQALIRQTTPILRNIAVATMLNNDGTDSSSISTDTSSRNTGDQSNAETDSINSASSSKFI